ncbi:MAG TPA: Fe-S protein, partial [Hyphomicrobiales bacterium]|nr:Fe-S protein [Hyphomicrobiales bacterium]
MFLKTAADKRPYHLGPYPLETLPRDASVAEEEAARPRLAKPADAPAPEGPLGAALRTYREIYADHAAGDERPQAAPVPDDLERRAVDIKGYAYFMNASQVGICRIPDNAWCSGIARPQHDHAVVILVAHGRLPEADNPARDWVAPALAEASDMRAAEIAVCLTRHIRVMGFPAVAHIAGHGGLDMERLAVLAGLAVRKDGTLRNPF